MHFANYGRVRGESLSQSIIYYLLCCCQCSALPAGEQLSPISHPQYVRAAAPIVRRPNISVRRPGPAASHRHLFAAPIGRRHRRRRRRRRGCRWRSDQVSRMLLCDLGKHHFMFYVVLIRTRSSEPQTLISWRKPKSTEVCSPNKSQAKYERAPSAAVSAAATMQVTMGVELNSRQTMENGKLQIDRSLMTANLESSKLVFFSISALEENVQTIND